MQVNFKCPACGIEANDLVDAFDRDMQPKEDDFSVCADCFALVQFNADMSVRMATKETIEKLDSDMQQALRLTVLELMGLKLRQSQKPS